MNPSYYKYCIVPQCESTTIKTPNKLFIYVPNNKQIRKKWLTLARRDNVHTLSTDSRMYFCEDHFDTIQAAAVQSIREQNEVTEKPVAPLRLPRGLEDSARADPLISAKVANAFATANKDQTDSKQNGEVNKPAEPFKQVQFYEPQVDQEEDDVEDGYENDYHEDYDYYNEEDEESAAYYACEGEAVVQQGTTQTTCDNAHVQLLFDQELYSPKIFVTDNDTGEILADMLIHTDTEFQMVGNSCTWTGIDYTSNDPVDKTVTMNFHNNDTALTFYDSCQTSKGATYSSTDPQS